MATGNNQQSAARTFLSVGFGKFRQKDLANKQKVDENTKGAVKRVTKQGKDTYALEFDYITGVIDSIFYKDNTGTEFANSFEVVIKDDILYQISFQDDSKFWYGFMELLPNVVISEPLTITVFDYTNKEKKRKSGINIEQFNNKNTREVDFKDNQQHNLVISFYKEYTEQKTWKFLHGYPVPPKDINWQDKDDVKMYFMMVKKFLKSEFTRLYGEKLVNTSKSVKEPASDLGVVENELYPPMPGEQDDLPY
jgi:hypothetical protein